MKRGILALTFAIAIAALAGDALAEANRIRTGRGPGFSFLPMYIVQHEKLIEKHARAARRTVRGIAPEALRRLAAHIAQADTGAGGAAPAGGAELADGLAIDVPWRKSKVARTSGGLSSWPRVDNTPSTNPSPSQSSSQSST